MCLYSNITISFSNFPILSFHACRCNTNCNSLETEGPKHEPKINRGRDYYNMKNDHKQVQREKGQQ